MAVEFTNDNFKEKVLDNNGVALVDFWAEWCGPCRMVAPVLEELSKEMSEKVTIKKLNVDDNQGTAQMLGIQSIPTLIVFKNGEMVDRVLGALPKTQIKNLIERHT